MLGGSEHSPAESKIMNATTKLQEAIKAFVKAPMAYDAPCETKEARQENWRKLRREWADGFWSAFERGVGSRFWEAAVPLNCGDDAKAILGDVNEFVVSMGHKVDLFGTLAFWAGKDGGFRAIWAQRFAKILFDQGVRDEVALVKYSHAYVNSLKAIGEVVESFSRRKDSAKVSQWRNVASQTAREFSALVEEMGDVEVRKQWTKYVRHYLVKWSGSEEDLAAIFTEMRNARARGDVSEESTITYAWVLHDCIRQAVDKFKNRKLVELFLSEIKSLSLKDLPSQKQSDIGIQLQKDIRRGGDFLDGTLDVWNQLKERNVSQAIALLAQKVREQPENLALRLELIECCVANGNIVEAFDSVNYFLTPGHISKGDISSIVVPWVSAITKYVMRFPRDNSLCFYSTKTGRKVPNWKLFKEGMSEAYVSFANEFIKDHLDDGDRQMITNAQGRSYKSLSERICECLFRCVVNGVDKETRPLIEKNGWVLDFVKSEFSLSKGWKCDGDMMVARMELLSGNVDAARSGFEKCIAKKPQDAEYWYWFGMTYAKGNDDFARCMCKSISLNSKGFCASEAHERLAEYFAANGRKPEQLRELQKAESLKREIGLATRISGQVLGMELLDKILPAREDEAEFKRLSEEADSLVSFEQRELQAVIVSLKRGSDCVRVYISDADRGVFVNTSASGLGSVHVGMPIVAVMTAANATEPLKLQHRAQGKDWDVFAASVGIVMVMDRNYGFVKIALDDGLIADVDERRFPIVAKARIGGLFLVRYEIRNGKVNVYHCCEAPDSVAMPGFVRYSTGALVRPNSHCEFGYVDNVFVPGELCHDLPEGTEVTVGSIKVPAHRRQKAERQAVKLETNEFKTGGGVVLRG